ncbi:hypothetical protein T12_10886 [Trichinella patagoniensis]|uniref:Uncharacterized protein n=1 Tax=Trichinella patagoniensis TaxID=990121 RepID=A0A0V0ZAR7_9BILA|nr:hypothetical protein T12_10886 [Trichinella patagoniensis]
MLENSCLKWAVSTPFRNHKQLSSNQVGRQLLLLSNAQFKYPVICGHIFLNYLEAPITLSQQRRTSLRRKNQFLTAHEQQFLLEGWKSTVPDAVYHTLELVPHWKVTGGFYLGGGIACQLIVNLLKDFPGTLCTSALLQMTCVNSKLV